jgi:hypothetical protein
MKSNKRGHYILLVMITIAVVCNYSCEKNELPVEVHGLSGVKMYADTLASGENSNIKVTAGSNRLYMTYGWGSSFWTYINGVVIPGQSEITNTLMSTDLKGNLLWKTVLPKGLSTGSPVEVNDGSCWIVAANVMGYSQFILTETIYMFRFDRDGNRMATDSFTLPSDFGTQYSITSLDMIKSSGGNILIYGSASDFTDGLTRGFAIEYNSNGGVERVKPVEFRQDTTDAATCLYNCIVTSDGGYMFLGTYGGMANPGNPVYNKTILIKTNSNCDTTWTKWFDYFSLKPPDNVPSPGNVIQLKNGGYRFCANDNPDDNEKKFRAFIYEVNAVGDSVEAYTINRPENAYCPYIINDNSGNTVALVNNYPPFLISEIQPVFNQINTTKYSFDAGMNLFSKTKFQDQRSDFLTSACMTPDGQIAVFGLFSTNDGRSYIPGLIYLR